MFSLVLARNNILLTGVYGRCTRLSREGLRAEFRERNFLINPSQSLLGICSRSYGDDKIRGGGGADIFDAVLVVGMNKSYRAWPHHMTRAIDGELNCSFADQPHFAVHVVMWGVGHRAWR